MTRWFDKLCGQTVQLFVYRCFFERQLSILSSPLYLLISQNSSCTVRKLQTQDLLCSVIVAMAYPRPPQPPSPQPSFSQSPMPCAGLQPAWNSSMAPSISTSWSSRLQHRENAMGVATTWVINQTPPCNIKIKHVDKRVTGKDSTTGQLIHSQEYSNTYYHPIGAAHITKKYPLFSGQVCLRYELHTSLDNTLRNYVSTLHSLNIVLK